MFEEPRRPSKDELNFAKLPKLTPGDKVAILSPSFAAPGVWPHVHELGLSRLREIFELEPVEFASTRDLSASHEQKAQDLIRAFEDPEIRAIICTLGGDDQVVWAKNLPSEPFKRNPKPFFGYSDNTHIMNHLWLNGIPSFYGGALFTEFAMQNRMDDLTVKFLRRALFEAGEFELEPSNEFNDIGLDWSDPATLNARRTYEPNESWYWEGSEDRTGFTWGGCLESIDEMLRHAVPIPKEEQFEDIILFLETSEEIPAASYVRRVFRAFGERGLLGRCRALLIGRPKSWEFDKPRSPQERSRYREEQRETILETVRAYSSDIPVVQNVDFGHTSPQICLPFGARAKVESSKKRITIEF